MTEQKTPSEKPSHSLSDKAKSCIEQMAAAAEQTTYAIRKMKKDDKILREYRDINVVDLLANNVSKLAFEQCMEGEPVMSNAPPPSTDSSIRRK